MWGEDSVRKFMPSSPRNVFLSNQNQFFPGNSQNRSPVPHSFCQNTFSPVSHVAQQNHGRFSPLQQVAQQNHGRFSPLQQVAQQNHCRFSPLPQVAQQNLGRFSPLPQVPQQKYPSFPPLQQVAKQTHPSFSNVQQVVEQKHPSFTNFQEVAEQKHPNFSNFQQVAEQKHPSFSNLQQVAEERHPSFSPLRHSADFDHLSSYSLEKQCIAPAASSETPLSSSHNFSYTSGHDLPQHHSSSTLSSKEFTRNEVMKFGISIVKRFSLRNTQPPQRPFLSETKNFGGIPFISDTAIHDSTLNYENCATTTSSVMEQEDDSLDYCYNGGSPGEANVEPAPSHSCETRNSSLDHSVSSQKSNDSYHTEENRCHVDINEGDSMENLAKRQKLDHQLDNTKSELEKHIKEVSDPVVGLDYITEFQKRNVLPSLYIYKCSLCNCSILAKNVLMHILGVKHRLKFLKTIDEKEHQRIVELRADQNELSRIMADVVIGLENKCGRGSVKVISESYFHVKNNEENNKCPERPSNISPTTSASSILPPGDKSLLNRIPEPPDIKLLNDILTTAQTLNTGILKGFDFSSKTSSEECEKNMSVSFETETVGSKWPVGCEIPPPPPLTFAERATSPWNDHLSPVKTSLSPAIKSMSDIDIANLQSSSALSVGTDKEIVERQLPYAGESAMFTSNLPESLSQNQNSEVKKDPSTPELTSSPHGLSECFSVSSDSSECISHLNVPESETAPNCDPEVLPKIPLINDSSCVSEIENDGKISEFLNVPDSSKPCADAVVKDKKEEVDEDIADLDEEQIEARKAAIFEHLSHCTVTNEEEANLVGKIIMTLSEMYFSYKLQDLPRDESEYYMQSLRFGEKEGVIKLARLLHSHPATATDHGGNDENSNNNLSSDAHPIQIEESENIDAAESNSNTVFAFPHEAGSKPLDDSPVSSHGYDKELNAENIVMDSTSSVIGCETELTDNNAGTLNSSDMKCVDVPADGKCSGDNTVQKSNECVPEALKFSFLPPPPPPPPPPPEFVAQHTSHVAISEKLSYAQPASQSPPSEKPASQIAVSEQQHYPPSSESAMQMSSYGSWPMAFYPATSQATGYMYWPTQNVASMDPSVMNPQFMVSGQNAETGLYSWHTQPPLPSQDASLPPLPPPIPPPPPPPTSTAP